MFDKNNSNPSESDAPVACLVILTPAPVLPETGLCMCITVFCAAAGPVDQRLAGVAIPIPNLKSPLPMGSSNTKVLSVPNEPELLNCISLFEPAGGVDVDVPVIVSVSPETAVVILVPPAILKVSLPSTAVPVESSPTKVIEPPDPSFVALNQFVPLYFKTCPLVGEVIVVSIILLSELIFTLYNDDASTPGSFPLASSCTILFAVVPTSTAIVPAPVIVPPVSPVLATMLVTVPVPDAVIGFQ